MSLIAFVLLAAGVGFGLVVAVAGLAGRRLFAPRPTGGGRRGGLDRTHLRRAGIAALAGFAVFVVTGWPAAAALTGLAGWALPGLLGGRAARQASIARTEAIAAWIEMVHGSIVAAAGLEEAIAATGPVAPEPIRPEVQALARRLEHLSLSEALVAFGKDLEHPSGDLVVASLVMAARMEASDMSGLLGRLATSTRDEARMRIRVEVGRTRVRTGAKVILGVAGATILLLAVTSRDYLAVYDGPAGQVMLVVVGSFFVFGGWLLQRLAVIDLPQRFNARPTVLEGGSSG